MTIHKTLILGGARSGKSRRALHIAEGHDGDLLFIATAETLDAEMSQRIRRHQQERGARWDTAEVPLALSDAIGTHSKADSVLLVDCLTLWLSNIMHHDRDVEKNIDDLCDATKHAPGTLVFVSNELGLGLVPETMLGRRFRDEQGRLNQTMASICDRVEFIAAGLPITLKG